MKLKCAGCLVNPKRGIRNAITVFDGVAMCEVHLKETVRTIKKAREEFIKQQREKDEKKIETTKKEEKKVRRVPTPPSPESEALEPKPKEKIK